MTRLFSASLPSPVGELQLIASETGVVRIAYPGAPRSGEDTPTHPVLLLAMAEIDEYFAGTRNSFTVPLQLEGTAFQQAVWEALREIPPGEATTYAALAARLGNPSAVRAVGAANGRNPLPILVPCHRVIGSDGTLTGYAGGLAMKRWLLDHERRWSGLSAGSQMTTGISRVVHAW